MFGWGEETVKAVGGAVTGTIESINYALSGDLPPDVRVKLEEIKLKMQSIEANVEHEITERWVSDNNGSWLSKNIRPGTLAIVTLFTMVLIVLDSYFSSFNVKDTYVDLLGTLLFIMYPAYFTAREIGKGLNLWTARMKK